MMGLTPPGLTQTRFLRSAVGKSSTASRSKAT